MADSQVTAALQVDQWKREMRYEYVRDSKFRRLMGKSENSPIQLVSELKEKPGDDITVGLVTRLTGSGQTGDNTLEGNEEALANYGHKITIDQWRHAVSRGAFEQKKTFFDLLKAGKVMLKKWAMNKLRDDIITAMYSANVDGSTAYGSCTEANKDAWLDANSDRILYGALKSNLSTSAPAGGATYDHSGSLGAVDSTDDIFTPTLLSLMKRMMKTADRHITPTSVNDKGEWFIALAPSLCFRDFKNDSTMTQANREAMARGKDNPLFTDGDLVYDGVIVKEVEEITPLSGVGAGSIDVAPIFFLGAQAVGIGEGKEASPIRNVRDYGNRVGVGIAGMRGIDKLMHNDIQNMGTLWCAAVADT